MPDLQSPIGRVRLLGRIEGVSFLLLMGIAMPLKYLAGQPLAVKFCGWAHGLLFIVLCMAIFQAWSGGALSLRRSLLAFLAALVPFGPFIIDARLAEDETRTTGLSAALAFPSHAGRWRDHWNAPSREIALGIQK